jgi:hypothetical protein
MLPAIPLVGRPIDHPVDVCVVDGLLNRARRAARDEVEEFFSFRHSTSPLPGVGIGTSSMRSGLRAREPRREISFGSGPTSPDDVRVRKH